MRLLIYSLFLMIVTLPCIVWGLQDSQLTYLQQGESFEFMSHKFPISRRFHVFCYEGRPKYIINLWQSVVLQINSPKDTYDRYEGGTPEEVEYEYQAHRSSWSLNLFSWKQKQLKLNPFNQSCIGIYSDENYSVMLHVIRIDYWKVLSLAAGVLLFISAEKLSKNTLFYYLCGISFGIAASFLILIYFMSKLFPRKPLMYGFAAAGWTVGLYMLQLLWDNVRVILLHYKIYLVYYAIVMGIISFMVCYRYGPVENERTKNLIKWSMQTLGLIGVFFSSEFQEAAMGQIVVLLLIHNMPASWLSKPKSFWKKKFPPKVKLLSSDEYYQQGVRETTKALDELRQYCSSPDCNQWKTALRLRDVRQLYGRKFAPQR